LKSGTLSDKKILIAVTGSIAAYKAAFLIRLLIKEGAEVKVIMTDSARDFITPLTLSVLSRNPVHHSFTTGGSAEWNNHVELGVWADLMIVAPASANTIGKMACGICDNLVLATYLSAKCPVFLAPAMDLDMYRHPSVIKNLETLRSFGNIVIPAASGELASGLYGEGRMAEPEQLLGVIADFFRESALLKGKKALVTAGPTYENIDPVRYIGNHASGKMGFCIAEELARKGAEVTLIAGPTQLSASNIGIRRIDVVSASEMYENTIKEFTNSDITIMAAAVADFAPSEYSGSKIKKESSGAITLQLKPTRDILLELGARKTQEQILIGFALETDNEIENARNKLARKNLDYIVLNSLRDEGAGFGTETNKITIIGKNNKISTFELKSKSEAAQDIINTCLTQ
jgi:phosphopantothenoylcysteine decarboxylase / phosphopantothenate---cysteine ligase